MLWNVVTKRTYFLYMEAGVKSRFMSSKGLKTEGDFEEALQLSAAQEAETLALEPPGSDVVAKLAAEVSARLQAGGLFPTW